MAVATAGVAPERAADEELALLAKALAHPARMRILRLLLGRDACFCGEIVDRLPPAQATVSQHLKVLKEAGLVEGEIDGAARVLRRLRERLAAVHALIGVLLEEAVELAEDGRGCS
jgi:ArsR family transcriptional regulator